MNFLNSLDTALGPMGWIAILGALGLTMVGATLVMILRQPEDPLAKLKRSQTEAADAGKQQRLRQSDRNEKLQKFAKSVKLNYEANKSLFDKSEQRLFETQLSDRNADLEEKREAAKIRQVP